MQITLDSAAMIAHLEKHAGQMWVQYVAHLGHERCKQIPIDAKERFLVKRGAGPD